MKKKVTLEVFEESVLPMLQSKHADNIEDVQKSITDDYEITDADGKPVKYLVGKAADAEAVKETPSDEATAKMVAKTVAEVLRADREANPLGHKGVIKVDDEKTDPKAGFKNFGEFAGAVKNHALGGKTDDRMKRIKAPTNYASEGVGADGGFLVPQDFSRELLKHAFGETSLLPLTRQLTTSGNSLTIPLDETTPWGTAGVQAYWTSEAGVKTDSKPQLGEVNITLHKLAVLIPVTDELLQDSFISLGDYLRTTAQERITQKVNAAIVAGTGAGQPLGYRNSSAYKVVSKESAQTADTVNVLNLAKMYAAMPTDGIMRATWLHSPSVFPQLVTTTVGNMPIWNPMLQSAPGGGVFGRPLVPSQQMSLLGDLGDIDFVDLSQYVTVTKGTGVEEAMSIHLYFDRDITTFRFVFRIGGRPWLTTPYTGKDGVSTYSPFVGLEAR